ncbi:MAG: hypothetical protein EXQ85_05365 [Alphaproteobacteria bacterium]|nr:hypothetical protein [Alphaproteobacteria bacterium]
MVAAVRRPARARHPGYADRLRRGFGAPAPGHGIYPPRGARRSRCALCQG